MQASVDSLESCLAAFEGLSLNTPQPRVNSMPYRDLKNASTSGKTLFHVGQIGQEKGSSVCMKTDLSFGDFETANEKLSSSATPETSTDLSVMPDEQQGHLFSNQTNDSVLVKTCIDRNIASGDCSADNEIVNTNSKEYYLSKIAYEKSKSMLPEEDGYNSQQLPEVSCNDVNLNKSFLPADESVIDCFKHDNIAPENCAIEVLPSVVEPPASHNLMNYRPSLLPSVEDSCKISTEFHSTVIGNEKLSSDSNATSQPLNFTNKSNPNSISAVTTVESADSKHFNLDIAVMSESLSDFQTAYHISNDAFKSDNLGSVSSSLPASCLEEISSKRSVADEQGKQIIQNSNIKINPTSAKSSDTTDFDDLKFDPCKSNEGLSNFPDKLQNISHSLDQAISTEYKLSTVPVNPGLVLEKSNSNSAEVHHEQNINKIHSEMQLPRKIIIPKETIVNVIESNLSSNKKVEDDLNIAEIRKNTENSKNKKHLHAQDPSAPNLDTSPKGSYTTGNSKFGSFEINQSIENDDASKIELVKQGTHSNNSDKCHFSVNFVSSNNSIVSEGAGIHETPTTLGVCSKSNDTPKIQQKNFSAFSNEKLVDDEPILQGSYSVNFSKFDDPNFNSFQSSKILVNNKDRTTKFDPKPAVHSNEFYVSDNSSFDLLSTFYENNIQVVKKEQKVMVINDPPADEDEEAVPKGSYSIDFSKFDDPNFNPFQSNKTLENDEDPLNESKPKLGTYSMNLDKVDDPNFDPFKTKKSIMNSPTKENDTVAFHKPDVALPTTPEQAVETMDDAISQSTAVTSASDSFNSQPIETNDSNEKSVTVKPKTKVVKKKRKPVIKNDPPADEDAEVVPKGTYSMDFSKFDDPNFNPFQSNKTLENDEDPLNESKPKLGAYLMNLDKVDDPNFDPFKTKKSIMNSPTKENDSVAFPKPNDSIPTTLEQALDDQISEPTTVTSASDNSSSKPTETNDLHEKSVAVKPKTKVAKKKRKPVIKNDPPADEDAEVVPKGTYSMDFSKFDDPNFNPFQSNKTLENDEDPLNESKPKLGAYSMNLDKVDDPNFDPFKTKKSIMNSPTKENDTVAFHKPDVALPTTPEQAVETMDDAISQSTAVTSASDSFNSQPIETNDSNKKSVTVKPKTKVVKKKRKPVIKNDPPADEDAEVVPKGTYSMDFSKFDDPNFNPFQSNKTLENDEDPLNESKPKLGAYLMNLDKVDDPNFDPFKTKKSIMNSPIKENDSVAFPKPNDSIPTTLEQALDDQISEPTTVTSASDNSSSKPTEINDLHEKSVAVKPKTKVAKKKRKPVIKNDPPADEDAEVVPKGTYSMDFSKFDDPNFNPFQSNKTLENDEDPLNESKPKLGAYSMNLDKVDDPNFDPFKTKKSIMNSPTKENDSVAFPKPNDSIPTTLEQTLDDQISEPTTVTSASDNSSSKPTEINDLHEKSVAVKPKTKVAKKKRKPVIKNDPPADEDAEVVPKGTYSMDFSKFDDPNFNPFQSNKTLENDEDPLNESKPKLGAYSMNLDKVDDPNFDPFKTKKSIMNSPTKENDSVAFPKLDGALPTTPEQAVETMDDAISQSTAVTTASDSFNSQPTKTNDLHEKSVAVKPKTKVAKKKRKPVIKNDPPADDETEVVPKGTYSMDFSKFDDPNFNPFQSNKTLENDEDPLNESKPKLGTYSMNLDKVDDPNFDPFKTKKSIMNSPTKENDSVAFPKPNDSIPTTLEQTMDHPISEPTTVTSASVNSSSKPTEINDLHEKSVAVKPKTKVAKKKRKPVIKNDPPADEDAEVVPKGTYSMDFSKFDDPNFNPFQSNKTLENDEDPLNESKPKLGAYSMNLDKVDDPNFDPFKTKKSIMNSPTKENDSVAFPKPNDSIPTALEQTMDDQISEPTTVTSASDNSSSKPTETNDLHEKSVAVKPKTKVAKKKRKPVIKNDPPADEDAEVVPKGTYSMDFSKFDDPNFNPFQSNKTLENDEDPLNESKPKLGAYSMNLDKVDDPNFDPFKTKKSIMNSPTKENDSVAFPKPNDSIPTTLEQTMDHPISEPTTVTSASDNSSSKPTETNDLHGKSVAVKPKTKVAKKKRKPVIKTDPPADEDAEVVPKGTYSMDFSKFDDPNFNPFQSNKTLENDEDPLNESKPKLGAYLMNLDKVDDPNFDPFKTKKSIMNSPIKENDSVAFPKPDAALPTTPEQAVETMDDAISQSTAVTSASDSFNSQPTETNDSNEKSVAVKPKTKVAKKKRKPVIKNDPPADEDAEVVPKGTYSMDFSKFDDPNFNPFQSNKTLENDEDPLNESKPKLGAYSMNLDKVDDPNFDPFKTKKSIMNSPTKENDTVAFHKPDVALPTTPEQAVETMDDAISQSTAVTSASDSFNSQPTETNDSNEKSVAVKPKTKVAKKKRKPVIKTDPPADDETEVVPKGTYSMDFSKFDDPNFNPFKSSKTIMNDDELAVKEQSSKTGSYTMDFDNFDDPNFDLFKSKKTLSNSANESKGLAESIDNPSASLNAEDVDRNIKVSPNLNETFTSDPAYSLPPTYDDSSFDPLKSNKTLSNSPSRKEPLDDEQDLFYDARDTLVAGMSAPQEDYQGTLSTSEEATCTLRHLTVLGGGLTTDEEFLPAEEGNIALILL